MNNIELFKLFSSSYISGQSALESNTQLRIEPVGDTLQLLAKTEGLVATAKLSGNQRISSIRYKSRCWPQLHQSMAMQKCLPVRQSKIAGFYEYQPIDIPENYSIHFTNSLDLLQTWWLYDKENRQRSLMSLLILYRGALHPIQNLVCERGLITMQLSDHWMRLNPANMLSWLKLREQPAQPPEPKKLLNPTQSKPKKHLKVPRRTDVARYPGSKRIGSYLVDAGLLSLAQVEVVLTDQDSSPMRFGEILVSRGWLNLQTVEFVFKNVILPHRTLAKSTVHTVHPSKLSSNSHRPELVKDNVADMGEESSSSKSLSSPQLKTVPVTPAQASLPTTGKLPFLKLPSIHEHETLSTYDNHQYSDYLPDWIER